MENPKDSRSDAVTPRHCCVIGWTDRSQNLPAYKAAAAKDAAALAALAALADRIDSSCTTCHKRFRPAVFPPAR